MGSHVDIGVKPSRLYNPLILNTPEQVYLREFQLEAVKVSSCRPLEHNHRGESGMQNMNIVKKTEMANRLATLLNFGIH